MTIDTIKPKQTIDSRTPQQKEREFRAWLAKTHNIYQFLAPEEVDLACAKIL